ncbi:hypothetical protein [Vibrio sp. WXL210]|uniref:hypothetical protein n=1 Tax=Vibrio sp. WXL210 TaxID=3450709 RepID=UPI003EC780DD
MKKIRLGTYVDTNNKLWQTLYAYGAERIQMSAPIIKRAALKQGVTVKTHSPELSARYKTVNLYPVAFLDSLPRA